MMHHKGDYLMEWVIFLGFFIFFQTGFYPNSWGFDSICVLETKKRLEKIADFLFDLFLFLFLDSWALDLV